MKSLQAKKFDFTLLKQKLSEQENVMMAFVFGSAKDGEQKKPDSDIAVWLKEPPTLDDRLLLLELCQETLQYDNIDLCFLNTASKLLRFEALSGIKLLIRDTEFYADFFSKTCRYYEDVFFTPDIRPHFIGFRCQTNFFFRKRFRFFFNMFIFLIDITLQPSLRHADGPADSGERNFFQKKFIYK